MSKQIKSVASAEAPASAAITLHEFCTRLSVGEKRVELIGAFESQERRSGRLKGTAEQYQARFTSFVNQPA